KELFSISAHLINLLLRQLATVFGDGDRILRARVTILCGHTKNAIDIDGEGDVNLGDTAWLTSQIVEDEITEQLTVFSHRTITLVDRDRNTLLIVNRGGKVLCLFCRNGRVGFDQGGDHTTETPNAERERGHI